MKWQFRLSACILAVILAATGLPPLHAQLPSIDRQPWIGYFAAHTSNRYQIGISSLGELHLKPVESGSAIADSYLIKIEPTVLETQSSGKTIAKRLIADSLETTDSATEKLEKATYRGKVTGDAAFEVTVEQNRGIVFVGGRLLDPGNLKNPLKFAISIKIPNLYPSERKSGTDLSEREKRREEKALADKLRGDRLSLKRSDDSALRQSLSETVQAGSVEINGPGITELELQSETFRGRRLMLNASPGTSMTLSNSKSAPLYQGFEVSWMPDPDKDPDAKARLAISCR